eukprot:scaffold122884_cov69-Phaeocystis_antarctica.AAC.3
MRLVGASYFSSSFLFDILGADASGPVAGTIGVRRGMTHRARCATLAHLFTTYGVPTVGFTVTLCEVAQFALLRGGDNGRNLAYLLSYLTSILHLYDYPRG